MTELVGLLHVSVFHMVDLSARCAGIDFALRRLLSPFSFLFVPFRRLVGRTVVRLSCSPGGFCAFQSQGSRGTLTRNSVTKARGVEPGVVRTPSRGMCHFLTGRPSSSEIHYSLRWLRVGPVVFKSLVLTCAEGPAETDAFATAMLAFITSRGTYF